MAVNEGTVAFVPGVIGALHAHPGLPRDRQQLAEDAESISRFVVE
jgi:hypothetical protein